MSVTLCTGFFFDKYRPIATGLASSGSGAGIFAIEKVINNIILKHAEGDPDHWRQFMRCEAIFLICCLIPVFLFRSPSAQKLKAEVDDTNFVKKTRLDDLVDDLSSSEDDSLQVKIFSMGRPSMISRNSNLSFNKYPTISEITPSFHVFTTTKQKKVKLN